MRWQIDPTRHVMRRRHALHLLLSPQGALGVLQAKAQQQVSENSPRGFILKAFERVGFRQFDRYMIDSGHLFAVPNCLSGAAEAFEKLALTAAMPKAEHVKNCGKDRRELELLDGER